MFIYGYMHAQYLHMISASDYEFADTVPTILQQS
jgi:hypothetical protein